MHGPDSIVPPEQQFIFPEDTFPVKPILYGNNVSYPTAMTVGLRRSARHNSLSQHGSDGAGPSGSEYNESDKSMEAPNGINHDQDPSPPPVEFKTSSRGRKIAKMNYGESSAEEEIFHQPDDDTESRPQRSTRRSNGIEADVEDDGDDDVGPPRYQLRGGSTRRSSFIATDDDEDTKENLKRYNTRGRIKKREDTQRPTASANGKKMRSHTNNGNNGPSLRTQRFMRRNATREPEDDVYVDMSSTGSADADGSIDDAPHTSDDPEPEPDPEPEAGQEQEDEADDGKPYALRARQRINYAIPPPLEEMRKPPMRSNGNGRSGGGGRNNGGGFFGGGGHAHGRGKRGPGWSATGAELGRWMGMTGDDSDSDHATRTPRKQPFGAGAFGAMGAGGGLLGGDLAAGGTPSNLGKIGGEVALADADPLGTNVNVTFDEVGGLDDHILSLKEMTLLPLLYPEVFQRFNVTPPRGVLFHGPPGTGKTLLARALAASCRSEGRSISFFMRKGADCLSKWVGEAERQLRLLFDEARACQPSIIFFDEIDGLAPVRSAKQDQIHASIVSTLLALMDGMDGRGQVIVIGATNRPDAVDPALRRPGRFDREFYFGLPGLDARERILGIMTKGWVGWGADVKEGDEPDEKSKWMPSEKLKGLAKLTKGYGGADLRALCTEASLNAVQRRYPQIYKTNDRLLLKPETIEVGLRDFMISVKKIVPSSARSTASAATPLPPQFGPLLNDTLERVKVAIDRVLPMEKRLTALEEAMFEDVDGEEGALDREMLMQSMQTLRVYRPRIVIHGEVGMGQGYVGAAALHHLEGYHIQTLELGTLMSDSTRTVEAALVQLFVEAKRHQPSVIYIPSLLGWCAAVSEASRSTVRAMLDTLAPTDPILLLVVVDGDYSELPPDVKAWFGPTKDNRVMITPPTPASRSEFFEGLIADTRRPPNHFADGVKRKARILEELPIAPPMEPRQPTVAELAMQEENDQRIVTLLKYRLGPILTELKRKFKRFTKRATDEYNFEESSLVVVQPAPAPAPIAPSLQIDQQPEVNGGVVDVVDVMQDEESKGSATAQAPKNELPNGDIPHPEQESQQQQMNVVQLLQLYDIDLEKMQSELFKGRYLTPQDFLDDVGKMVHNANARAYEDPERLYKAQAMFTATEVSIQEFDPQFRLDCERTAVRERKRREERRLEKEKEKEKEASNGQTNGTRRSARANGQQPEMGITDVAQLERRLKRQRSNEAASDEHPSEEEPGETRDIKRTRMIDEDIHHDPLNIISPAPTVTQPRVHFVLESEPIVPPPDLNSNDRGLDMVVDEAPLTAPGRRSGGFDPSLLNPLPSYEEEENPFYISPPSAAPPIVPSVPLPALLNGHTPAMQPGSSAPMSATPPSELPAPPRSRTTTKSPEPTTTNGNNQQPSPAPMVVERTPTPLPDFHINDALVADLEHLLRDHTESLTVEELEQLRATCLGCVWRHRTEWNRDALLNELLVLVNEFVAEINLQH